MTLPRNNSVPFSGRFDGEFISGLVRGKRLDAIGAKRARLQELDAEADFHLSRYYAALEERKRVAAS